MSKIVTTQELLNTIDFLRSELRSPSYTLGNKLSVSDTNNMFAEIQTLLNVLYEKARLLEDMETFAKKYIQNEFQKSHVSINEAVKTLESTSDLYQDTTYVAHETKFTQKTVVTDRDGTPISPLSVIDGNVMLPFSRALSRAVPMKIVTSSSHVPYRRITNPVTEYRSFYALEMPAQGELEETIQILFSKTVPVNFIRGSVFHAAIKNVFLIREDGETIEIPKNDLTIPRQNIKGIQMTIKSDDLTETTAYITESKDNYGKLSAKYEQEVLDSIYNTIISQKGTAAYVY